MEKEKGQVNDPTKGYRVSQWDLGSREGANVLHKEGLRLKDRIS